MGFWLGVRPNVWYAQIVTDGGMSGEHEKEFKITSLHSIISGTVRCAHETRDHSLEPSDRTRSWAIEALSTKYELGQYHVQHDCRWSVDSNAIAWPSVLLLPVALPPFWFLSEASYISIRTWYRLCCVAWCRLFIDPTSPKWTYADIIWLYADGLLSSNVIGTLKSHATYQGEITSR